LSGFIAISTGDSRAFGTFSDDPFGLGSGVVLSTGQVAQIPGVNTVSGPAGFNDLSTDLVGSDSISLTITFMNNSATSLFFNFVFGSEEFKEYAGTSFNDAFELRLNGVNLAKLSDNQLVTISNLTPSQFGPTHPDYIDNPAGPTTLTRLDGYTIVETFSGTLAPGLNTLLINIRDVGDDAWDSAVFIEGGTLGSTPPAVPEPGSMTLLGLSVLGMAGYGWRRRRLSTVA
jgi:hypothetical protein